MDTDSLPVELPSDELLGEQQRALIRVAAALAAYCEHVEHNEPHHVVDVAAAGDQLRRIASTLAHAAGVSLLASYRTRIAQIEAASIHSATAIDGIADLAGVDALRQATTWRQVQVAQLIHDRRFHPDVFGLSKLDQLRHYTLHVTKLAGLLTDADDDATWSTFVQHRLPDLAVFGVKLATACNQVLVDKPVDHVH
jgi:hypothetical protein